MDEEYNKIQRNERYVITDMIIFTISVTIVLFLLLNCLRIYADSEQDARRYLLSQIKNTEIKLANKIDKSMMTIELCEERILHILAKQSKINKKNIIKTIRDIKRVTDYKGFHFIFSKENKEFSSYSSPDISKSFKADLKNKKIYITINDSGVLVCKNVFFQKKIIGTITIDPTKDSFKSIRNSKNTDEFLIIDDKSNRHKVVEKKERSQTIQDNIQQFTKNHNTEVGAWVNPLNGENIALIRSKKYNLVIRLQMNQEFIKNKMHGNIIIKFIEISVFSLFFFLLMTLISRKDKIRNEYTKKLKEDAIYANKAKSDFLAYTAHEIRSPLGFIITGTEMIKSGLLGPISEKCKEYIEGINLNAQSILNFIKEILDESKILQNRFSLDRDFYEVDKILLDVIQHNKTKFYSKKINIITDFQDNLPLLYCDNKKLYQVINNLVTNSCKYSKDAIVIEVKVIVDMKKMFIIIQDNGIGMTPDEVKIAMRKYESVHFDNKPDSYGLGLSIVKLLIDAHEARFYLTSEKNVGTCATIVFNQKFLKY